MKTETINGLTFEEARKMVQGSKFKSLSKFKQFATPDFNIDDMKSELEIAIIRAWRSWDPEKSKFNTYCTNFFDWAMNRQLDTKNHMFKMNKKTKDDLKAKGETFATISAKGLTLDDNFNREYGLDEGEKFTREIWNQYVYSVTAKTFGITFLNQSQFTSDADGEFDILESSGAIEDDHFMIEVEKDMDKLQTKKEKLIVEMILAGKDINEIAKKVKMTAKDLMIMYAPTEQNNPRDVMRLQKRRELETRKELAEA